MVCGSTIRNSIGEIGRIGSARCQVSKELERRKTRVYVGRAVNVSLFFLDWAKTWQVLARLLLVYRQKVLSAS